MGKEKSLVIIKPDAFERSIHMDVYEFLVNGMDSYEHSLEKVEFVRLSKEKVEKHYEEHKNKPFFGELVEFMTSGLVAVLQFEGNGVVKRMRNRALEARTLFQANGMKNIVHASDSAESGLKEVRNIFGD